MAIPQPTVVASRADYERNRQASLANATQSVATFAQTREGQKNRQFKREELEEKQRQFDVVNLLKTANDIRNTQHRGNWVAFAQDNPNIARRLIGVVFGDNEGVVEDIYLNLTEGTPQTRQQVWQGLQDYYYKQGFIPESEGQGPPPGTIPASQQQGESTLPEQPYRLGQFNPNVPSAGEATQERKTYPQAGFTGGRSVEEDYAYKYDAENPSLYGIGKEETAAQTEKGKQFESEYAREVGDFQVNESGQMIDERGLPIADGQQGVGFPINRATLDMIGGAELRSPDKGGTNASIGRTMDDLAAVLRRNGASEEAAEFAKKGTAFYFKPSTSDKQRAEFDKKARKHFGVDGDTWVAIRNQMIENTRNGRPLNWMPPDDVKKDLYWWSGTDPAPAAKAGIVANDPEADIEVKAQTAEELTRVSLLELSPEELQNVSTFMNSATGDMLTTLSENDDMAREVLKKINVPEEATDSFQQWLVALNESDSMEEFTKRVSTNPKGRRIAQRVMERTQLDLAKAARKEKQKSQGKLEKAQEAVGSGNYTFEQRFQVTKDRAEQIMRQYEGLEPMEYAVEKAVPLEERRFEEAQSQFKTNVDLRREAMPTEEEKAATTKYKKEQAKMLAAQTAIKEMELDMMKDQYEAFKNGEAPQDFSMAIKWAENIFNMRMEDIHDDCDSATCVSRELKEALKEPMFKTAYETMTKLTAAISGLDAKEVEASYRERGWFATKFGTAGEMTSEGTIPVIDVEGGSRGGVPPTVTDTGGGGGRQQTSEGDDYYAGYNW